MVDDYVGKVFLKIKKILKIWKMLLINFEIYLRNCVLYLMFINVFISIGKLKMCLFCVIKYIFVFFVIIFKKYYLIMV